MAYNWKIIKHTDASFMKGMAMLLILFHNFSHLIKPWNGENEFSFSYDSTIFFLNLIRDHPENIIQYLFSFAGHYGVQVFVFLSGYGLFVTYHNRHLVWSEFMKRRLIKLYPAYIVTVVVYLIILTLKTGDLPSWVLFRLAIADLLFIQTFIPGEAYRLVGPWWFFPMIVQLYMIFPFLLAAFKRWGPAALIIMGVAAWLVVVLINPHLNLARYNLHHFFIGHLPVFCLGMFFAGKKEFRINWFIICGAAVVVITGNVLSYIWPFTMLAAALFLVVILRIFLKIASPYRLPRQGIQTIGINSLFIFLVHGFLREPFVAMAQKHAQPFITVLAALLFLLISLIVAKLVKKMQSPIYRKGKEMFLKAHADIEQK